MGALLMLLLSVLVGTLAVFDWLAATFGMWAPLLAALTVIAVPVSVLVYSGSRAADTFLEEAL